MTLKNITLAHVRLISQYWTRFSVRSGSGLVYLMIVLTFGLSVAHMLISPVELLMVQQERDMGHRDPNLVQEMIMSLGKPVVKFVLGTKSLGEVAKEASEQPMMMMPAPMMEKADTTAAGQWAAFLLEERPALLSAIFLILVFGMPFAISFLAFNQISGDVQSRGLRYLLLRTERSNIFLGRFLGTAVFSTGVIAFLILTIVLYLGLKTGLYPAKALLVWSVQGFYALSMLMLPYIAVCAMISACVSSPFLSLILAKLIIAGTLLFAALGTFVWEPLKYIKYLLPWGWQNHLLHPSWLHWGGAGLACLAYTAVFLMLGYRRFEKRDL
jgi:ABC-type transport system involved in multi-copper enzyme maturation permease subunit